jgi:hypothetical protein
VPEEAELATAEFALGGLDVNPSCQRIERTSRTSFTCSRDGL